jgi:hypothetical protein
LKNKYDSSDDENINNKGKKLGQRNIDATYKLTCKNFYLSANEFIEFEEYQKFNNVY